jgi:hypothetical protein
VLGNTITDSTYGIDPEACTDCIMKGNSYTIDSVPNMNDWYPKGLVLYGNQLTGDAINGLDFSQNTFRKTPLAVANGTQLTPICETSGSTLTAYSYSKVAIHDNIYDINQTALYNNVASPANIWTALTEAGAAPLFSDNIFLAPHYASSNSASLQVPTSIVYPIESFISINPGSALSLTIATSGGIQNGHTVDIYNQSSYPQTWANGSGLSVSNSPITQSGGQTTRWRYSTDASAWVYQAGGTAPTGGVTSVNGGSSGAVACSPATGAALCDVVTSLVPLKATANTFTGLQTFTQPAILANYTVGTLPACSGFTYGFAAVSDASSPTYNGTLTGGGTQLIPVFCNGTNWSAH